MTRIEKIIVVVLGLLSLSLLSYIIGSWTSQTAPVAAAPVAPAAAKVDPSAKVNGSVQPKCDSAEAAATVKNMALQKFNSAGGWDLVPNRGIVRRIDRERTGSMTKRSAPYWDELSPENLTLDSFRKRGVIGEAGLSCAALIGVHAVGDNYPVNTLSVEYTIEPTTDGKTMVSARFKPN
jgi:hypothetical protein